MDLCFMSQPSPHLKNFNRDFCLFFNIGAGWMVQYLWKLAPKTVYGIVRSRTFQFWLNQCFWIVAPFDSGTGHRLKRGIHFMIIIDRSKYDGLAWTQAVVKALQKGSNVTLKQFHRDTDMAH